MACKFFKALATFAALGGCATTDRIEMREASASECTAEGGYDFALSNAQYLGGCPPHLEAGFLEGYVLGRRVRRLEEDRHIALAAYSRELMKEEAPVTEGEIRKPPQSVDRRKKIIAPAARDDDLLAAGKRLKAIEVKLENARQAAVIAVKTLGEPSQNAATGKDGATEMSALASAHAFARAHTMVNHCTDELRGRSPNCTLAEDARIIDTSTGAVCVEGAGALKFLASEVRRTGAEAPQRVDIYEFCSAKADSRDHDHGAVGLVSDPETGVLLGVTCVESRAGR